jgi:DNA invertase Pin-like site-specific DNA recombinase
MKSKDPFPPRRAAIYARVSTADQDADRQVRDLRAFAKRAGFKVAMVAIETASGAKTERRERAKVLAAAQAREIEAVLVTEASRWSRSTADLLSTLQDLAAWNVSLVAERGLTFDLSSAQGKMIATIVAAFAEFERDLIRERVKSGMASARAKGKRIGRPKGNRAVEKNAAKIRRYRKDGLSIRQIARAVGQSTSTVQTVLKQSGR